MKPEQRRRKRPADERPIYWFAILDMAIADGDFATAAQAVNELERFGISITYRARPRRRGEPCLTIPS